MKKVFAVLLAMTLLFGLVACKGDPADSTGNLRPEDLMAGKYMIYEVQSPSGIKSLFLLDISGQSDSYVQLNANGTLAGSLMGESVKDAAWDLSDHTITVAGGESFAFTLEHDMLTVTVRDTTLIYLREGDVRLSSIPSPLEFLYSHIWANGQFEGMDRILVCQDDDFMDILTMIATEDGDVIWKLDREDGSVLEMTLKDGAKSQTITMDYHGDRCKATVKTANVQAEDLQLSSFQSLDTEDMAELYEELMREAVAVLLSKAQTYLENDVQIPMSVLGFTNYKQ